MEDEDEQFRQAIAASLVVKNPTSADEKDEDLQRALAASKVDDSAQTEEDLLQNIL